VFTTWQYICHSIGLFVQLCVNLVKIKFGSETWQGSSVTSRKICGPLTVVFPCLWMLRTVICYGKYDVFSVLSVVLDFFKYVVSKTESVSIIRYKVCLLTGPVKRHDLRVLAHMNGNLYISLWKQIQYLKCCFCKNSRCWSVSKMIVMFTDFFLIWFIIFSAIWKSDCKVYSVLLCIRNSSDSHFPFGALRFN